MVGGLVQQEHVGVLKKNLGQFYTHAPSSREFACGTFQVHLTEAKAHERALQLAHVFATAHHLQVLAFVGELLAQLHVALALIVITLGHLSLQSLDAHLHVMQMCKGLLRLLAHGARVSQLHHLWQVSYGHTLGHRHRASGGMLHSCYYLEHSALASTVLAHQGYAVSIVHHIRYVGKQRASTEFY